MMQLDKLSAIFVFLFGFWCVKNLVGTKKKGSPVINPTFIRAFEEGFGRHSSMLRQGATNEVKASFNG